MKLILHILKLFAFWIVFFAIQRMGFIFYNFSQFRFSGISDFLQIFFHALSLDLSSSAYLVAITFFTCLLTFYLPLKWQKTIHKSVGFILLFLVLLISVGNTVLYKEWQSLLSARAISFLLYPREVLASFKALTIFIIFILFILILLLHFIIWNKFLTIPVFTAFKKIPIVILYSPPLIVLLIVFMRGGLQLVPINESAVYYSNQLVYNHAAVNPVWYLGNQLWNKSDDSTKFKFMSDDEAEKNYNMLFHPSNEGHSLSILTKDKPNIIFIILESHTADVIESLGGETGLSKNIDSLAANGILFSQIYASGSRTDQSLPSVICGFPALPDKSIIKFTEKVSKLPSLYKDLNKMGYSSSFFYGGESEFANMNAFLLQSGVKRIIDKKDFYGNQMNSKWGAHDEFVFSRQIKELKTEKQPFVSLLLTLTNHEPFETPGKYTVKESDDSKKFRNTATYTDQCLGKYFKEASKFEWFKNTLFVIVADHGHRLPKGTDLNFPQSKHIPLIFIGDVIDKKFRGIQIAKIGNQHDLAATILEQMHCDYNGYEWSKNLLNEKSVDFAYYANENVLGFVMPQDTMVYSFIENRNINKACKNPQAELLAKSYLQKVYKRFLLQ